MFTTAQHARGSRLAAGRQPMPGQRRGGLCALLLTAAALMAVPGCAAGDAPHVHLPEDLFRAMSSGDAGAVDKFLNHPSGHISSVTRDLIAEAAHSGHPDVVRLLLDAGADPNRSIPGMPTPLQAAAEGGHADVVGLLLGAGADVNMRGLGGATALHAAAQGGTIETVRLLLEAGADPSARVTPGRLGDGERAGWTPLHCAVWFGHGRTADLLMQNGAEPDAYIAAHRGDVAAVRAAMAGAVDAGAELGPPGDSLLLWAAHGDRPSVVRVLVAAGAGPDADDLQSQLALHIAAAEGAENAVRALLQEGADTEAADSLGRRPLHIAAMNDRTGVLGLLLNVGAEVEAEDAYQVRALHYAAGARSAGCVELLLAAGAEPAPRSYSGGTPLFSSAGVGSVACMRLLLDAGADPELQTDSGMSPLDNAALGGWEDAVALLVDEGVPLGSALRVASLENEKGVVRILLARYPEERAAAATRALPTAARWGRFDVGRLLLAAGAEHNALSAAAMGDVKALDRLLEADAGEVGAKSERGEMPLHWAAAAGTIETARLLLDRGANVDGRDRLGRTPLRTAIQAGRADMVRFLVEQGADVTAADRDGFSPLQVAEQLGLRSLARTMKKAKR